jgi:hypothetical protein
MRNHSLVELGSVAEMKLPGAGPSDSPMHPLAENFA